MKAGRLLFLSALLLSPLHAADPLDKLIMSEQEARDEWAQDADELPPASLWGNRTGVELSLPLCEPLPFDELIELSRGNPQNQETVLNLDLPRVREIMDRTCLVRPGDPLMAVGPGEQQRVALKNFVIRRDRPACSDDSPYSLWGTFPEPLPWDPIFFSSLEGWPEGGNAAVALTESPPSDESELRARVAKLVKDLSDFRITTIDIKAPNADALIVLRRKVATLEDDMLSNDMVLRQQGELLEVVWSERVDSKKGSGSLRPEVALDFNGDNFTDLVLSGTHQGCPYRLVLEGGEMGFSTVDLPQKTCFCP